MFIQLRSKPEHEDADGERTTAITKGDHNLAQDPGFVNLAGRIPRAVIAIPYLGWRLGQKFDWSMFGIVGLLGLWVLPLAQRTDD